MARSSASHAVGRGAALVHEQTDTKRFLQGIGNLPPAMEKLPDQCDSVKGIVRRERLGGLLKWYERWAA